MSLNFRTGVALGVATSVVIGTTCAYLSRTLVPFEEALQVRNILLRQSEKVVDYPFSGTIYTKSFPMPPDSNGPKQIDYKVFLIVSSSGEELIIHASGSSPEASQISALVHDGNPSSETIDGWVNKLQRGTSENTSDLLKLPPVELEGTNKKIAQVFYYGILKDIIERSSQ